MVRVALVGCGIISEHHIRGYGVHVDRARITVCCDVDPGRANARADRVAEVWGTRPRVTTDYREILADSGVDSIELCTPSHLHADAVIEAAEAGKNVMCQKPLATNLADCDRMIAAAKSAGIELFYGEFYRTWWSAREARRRIDSGELGQIVGLESTYAFWQGGEYAHTAWRYDPGIAGGGQLIDGGIHNLDAVRSVGGPIVAVSCSARRVRPELGGEDTTALIFEFENGSIGSMMSTHAAALRYPGPVLIVYGTEAILSVGIPPGDIQIYRKGRTDNPETIKSEEPDLFASMAGHYLDVLEGKPNLCTAESGREMLQIVFAAYRSAELGRSVRVDEISA